MAVNITPAAAVATPIEVAELSSSSSLLLVLLLDGDEEAVDAVEASLHELA